MQSVSGTQKFRCGVVVVTTWTMSNESGRGHSRNSGKKDDLVRLSLGAVTTDRLTDE